MCGMAKCNHCGLLGVRVANTGVYEEADFKFRIEGGHQTAEYMQDDFYPVCFGHQTSLWHEARQAMPKMFQVGYLVSADAIRQVIQKDRPCQAFTPWLQGIGPREHREIVDRAAAERYRQEQLTREQEYRDEQRRREEEWRAEQRRLELDWQKRQEDRLDKQESAAKKRHDTALVVTGVFATAAVVAATLASAHIQRGYFLTPPSSPAEAPIVVRPRM